MRAEQIKCMFAGLTEHTKNVLAKKLPIIDVILKVNEDLIKASPANPLAVLTPRPELIFEAFRKCPIESTRVVIIGQDPYIKPGEAMGLSFSVSASSSIPPSLKNIYKCLHHNKLINEIPKTGNLVSWANQGVLLLNSALTTRLAVSNAHAGIWNSYTDLIIKELSDSTTPILFVLFGKFAQDKKSFIDIRRHLVYEWGHPSNLNRDNGDENNPKHFKYCNIFNRVNEHLSMVNGLPINWDPATTVIPSQIPLGFREVSAPCLGTTTESVTRYQPRTTIVSLDCFSHARGSNMALPHTTEAPNLPTANAITIPTPNVNTLNIDIPNVITLTANTPNVITLTANAITIPTVITRTYNSKQPKIREWCAEDPQCYTSDTIWIFTDGGSSANGKTNCVASYGWYVTNGEIVASLYDIVPEVNIPGIEYKSSNNRGELSAILSALQFISTCAEKFNCEVITIVSDSEYSIKSISTWIYNWEKDMKKHADKKNLDLIAPAKNIVEELKKKYAVNFKHVRSHRAEPSNNDCEEWFIWKCNDIVDVMCNVALGRCKE